MYKRRKKQTRRLQGKMYKRRTKQPRQLKGKTYKRRTKQPRQLQGKTYKRRTKQESQDNYKTRRTKDEQNRKAKTTTRQDVQNRKAKTSTRQAVQKTYKAGKPRPSAEPDNKRRSYLQKKHHRNDRLFQSSRSHQFCRFWSKSQTHNHVQGFCGLSRIALAVPQSGMVAAEAPREKLRNS